MHDVRYRGALDLGKRDRPRMDARAQSQVFVNEDFIVCFRNRKTFSLYPNSPSKGEKSQDGCRTYRPLDLRIERALDLHFPAADDEVHDGSV